MTLSDSLATRRDAILEEMRSLGRIVIAFSGGVDSAVVAALAQVAIPGNCLAATAVSETLAGRELEEACELAREIGLPHELVAFSELDDQRFVENSSSRCFFCQSMRFSQMRELAKRVGFEVVASGSNFSDLSDHRPGLKAMVEQGVYQPLLRHEVTKAEVRALAKDLGLSVWDKPAKACLSSRIPHGLHVTQERLRRVERAEDSLHELGFVQYRVRDHGGVARVEIAAEEMPRALGHTRQISTGVLAAGFSSVSLDLVGYRSGNLNPDASAPAG